MSTHNFRPGDLIQDDAGAFGIVVRTNSSEIIVGWQDVDVAYWDTDPATVKFVAHIPAAEVIDDHQTDKAQAYEQRHRERIDRLIKTLERTK